MKRMKRIVACLLAVGMVFSIAACGGSEQSVTLRGDMSDDVGLPATDTWTLTAKGDTVQTLKEVMEIDLSSYDDETKDAMITYWQGIIVEPAKAINGVTCKDNTSGSIYTIEFSIDCTNNDTVSQASAAGLIQIDGNSSRLSLKATQSSLESQGYTVVE